MDEARWLVDRMNAAGLGNRELAQALTDGGWPGRDNNISNWRTGQARIPLDLLPRIVHALGLDPRSGAGLREVLRVIAARHPDLQPYLLPLPAPAPRPSGSVLPSYVGRRGRHRGLRFVPARDAQGRYSAARSTADPARRSFADLASLRAALKADPELRLRMVPEAHPEVSPSLIHQGSLSWG